jgi:hypothetical protein
LRRQNLATFVAISGRFFGTINARVAAKIFNNIQNIPEIIDSNHNINLRNLCDYIGLITLRETPGNDQNSALSPLSPRGGLNHGNRLTLCRFNKAAGVDYDNLSVNFIGILKPACYETRRHLFAVNQIFRTTKRNYGKFSFHISLQNF